MKDRFSPFKIIVIAFFCVAAALFFAAVVGTPTEGEANIGSFDSLPFNQGWLFTDAEGSSTVDLPYEKHEASGAFVSIKNRLPRDIQDGMRFSVRTSLTDIFIYIDGELRESYSTGGFADMAECIPSAYVFADLTHADSEKEITIEYTVKSSGIRRFSETHIAYGNNAWFTVIRSNMPVVMASVFSIIIAIMAFVIAFFTRKKINTGKSIFYLSGMIVMVGCWMLSESSMRQLLFRIPSLSRIFAYVFMELICCMTVLYINEVQHRSHEKVLFPLEAVLSLEMIVLAVLNFSGIAEYHRTLTCSHISIIAGMLIIFITIVDDIRKKRSDQYHFIAFGFFAFILFCAIELLGFYFINMYTLGLFVCIGMLILLSTTVIQVVHDEIESARARYSQMQNMSLSTIQAVAKAIDAKDEYTGGHSERVSRYGATLARAVAKQYHLSEAMIGSIQYSGLIHDIGKIGIPDAILNKPDAFTDEEYCLMKRHPAMGYEIIRTLDYIEGVADGVKYHHERYDGKGYPEGLSGEEIPLFARILCLADSYDAMSSDRVYRRHLTKEDIKREISRNKGTQFDPNLTDAFIELLENDQL